jgi:hypothetical protein
MNDATMTWPRDPAFGLGQTDRLDPPIDTDLLVAWRHCTSLVVRDRLDLEAHTRRILLACTPQLADRADGALIDLFQSVGTEGQGLKRLLLQQADAQLSPAVKARLSHWLASGADAGGAWPLGTGHVVGHDTVGRTDLVSRVRLARVAETPLQQAVALIDEGQLDTARQVLEEALMADPEAADVAQELLGLYRHLRDTDAPATMALRLRERHQRLPAGWP